LADCAHCRTANAADRRFCAACGAPLPQPCPACGFANAGGDRFCGGCGRQLGQPAAAQPQPELRSATVLFVDLVGYTRQTATAGAEALHDLLGHFFRLADAAVERWGGHVDKHIGDAVMAVFGAPVAHENDPERALRAAVEILAAVGRLSFPDGTPVAVHAALATGLLLAAETGSDRHATYTVTGAAANLAARLHDLAGPGEIWLDPRAADAVAAMAELEPLPPRAVAGLAQPVTPSRFLALRHCGQQGEPPLVGRAGELTRLKALLDEARQGQGVAVRLRGEAGLGKSRLARALLDHAQAQGLPALLVQVLDFGLAADEAPLRRLAEGLLGRVAEGEALLAGLAAPRRAALLELLARPLPAELSALWALQGVAARRQALEGAVADLAQAATAHRALLLVVEDLHWADAALLGALAALRAAAAERPLLLLLTMRAEGDPFAPGGAAQAQRAGLVTLDLAPLAAEASLALARHLTAAVPALERALLRAEGNPLYLIQLLRHAGEGPLPDSLQGLVQARLDRLEPPVRALLRAAAVLGQRADPAALAALLESSPADFGASLAVAQAQGWLVPEVEGLRLSHALVREAIHAGLTAARRQALHRRAADWYRERDLALAAEHLAQAGDAEAAACFAAAAEQAADRHQLERALALAERGLALAGAAAKPELLLRAGELGLEAGQAATALARLDAALAAPLAPVTRARALLGRAGACRLLERLDEALAALAEAEPLLRSAGDRATLSRLCHLRGNLHFPRGEVALCHAAHAAALAHAEEAGDRAAIARAHGGLGDALYAAGRYASAAPHFAKAIAEAEAIGLLGVAVANRPMEAFIALAAGAPIARVLALATAAQEMARRLHQPRAEIIASHGLFFAYQEGDDPAAAEATIEPAQRLALQYDLKRFAAENIVFLASLRRRQGRSAEALALAREALAMARASGIAYIGPIILAEIWLLAPPAEAAAALAEAEALLAVGGIAHNDMFFHRALLERGLESGDAALLARAATAFRRLGAPEPMGWFDFNAALAEAALQPGAAALDRVADLAGRQGYRWALPWIERLRGRTSAGRAG
jgi:class 3 adenylate cyclase